MAAQNTEVVEVNGFEAATVNGFAPRTKEWTAGATLVSIEGMRDPENPERTIAKVSKKGNKYWTLVFDDGTRFTLLEKARRALLYPSLMDGSANPNYLEHGIYPGMKFEAKHVKADNGDGVVTILRYVD